MIALGPPAHPVEQVTCKRHSSSHHTTAANRYLIRRELGAVQPTVHHQTEASIRQSRNTRPKPLKEKQQCMLGVLVVLQKSSESRLPANAARKKIFFRLQMAPCIFTRTLPINVPRDEPNLNQKLEQTV